MWSPLVVVVITTSLVTMLLGLVVSLRQRPPGRVEVLAAVLTASAVLVQTVVGLGLIIAGERPQELATTIGYLLGVAVIMPLGVGWALTDRSRYSGYVIAVAAFTVAVMTARLVMLTRGTHV